MRRSPANKRAPEGAAAADVGDGEDLDRAADAELLRGRGEDAEIVGVEAAHHAGEEAGHGEVQKLVAGGVEAEALGGELVLADGLEGEPDAAS